MSEKKDTIYVKGVRIFPPNEGAPDYVKGSVIISPEELMEFIKEMKEHLTDYKGNPQLRCKLLEGKNGLYMTVDTYKKGESIPPEIQKDEQTFVADGDDDLPF